ncbi:MAG: hypothetical protein LAP86_27910 [Acidobacteriia bacterium]|nr:hypothetical protein [Terriglobia bacterium]
MPDAQTPVAASAPMTLLGEEFFGEEELAAFLQKKLRTIRWWREKKSSHIGPPWITIGNSVFYRKSSVLKWLLQNENEPHISRTRRRKVAKE